MRRAGRLCQCQCLVRWRCALSIRGWWGLPAVLCPNEITRRNTCHTLSDLCALVLCFCRLCLQVRRESPDMVEQSSIHLLCRKIKRKFRGSSVLQTRLKSLSSMDTAVLDEKEVICWQSDNSVRYVEIDRVTTVWWSSSTTYNVQNCAPEPKLKQIKLKTKLTKARRIQLCLRLETQIKLKERRIQTNSKPEKTNQIKVVHLFLNNAFITRFERVFHFVYIYI